MEAQISSYTVEVWKRFLHYGSEEDCIKPVVVHRDHKIFLRRGSMEKFLHCGSVEKFLHHRSKEGSTELVVVN